MENSLMQETLKRQCDEYVANRVHTELNYTLEEQNRIRLKWAMDNLCIALETIETLRAFINSDLLDIANSSPFDASAALVSLRKVIIDMWKDRAV